MSNKVELNDESLTITRVFNAPRELVFDAFRQPEKIADWSGCAGAECLDISVDFKIGGSYRQTMRIAQGSVLTTFGTYKEILVPERIAYTLEWEPMGTMQIPGSKVLIEFEDQGDKTLVRLTHSELVMPEMRENVPGGWQASFDKLGETIDQGAMA